MPLVWSIKWDSRAIKEVAEIPEADRKRIVDAVERLAADPLRGKPLKGRWEGLRRIRVGVYRIIYALRKAELTILVLRVGSRSDVYR
ncbi:Addiction module toxin, RelE/StbE family [Syntrophobacter sp. SbD1]|nr:Addiction module toxin, RelE/StbE family [Syntrophobacter sp. SbD1]